MTSEPSVTPPQASVQASEEMPNAASNETAKQAPKASSVPREIGFGVVGGVVAVACFLPPLLHFVTGPLGPLIGGFLAAQQVKPAARGRVIIVACVGLVLAGIATAGALAISAFAGSGGPPDWFPKPDALALILAGVWLYASALAAVGVAASAMFQARATR